MSNHVVTNFQCLDFSSHFVTGWNLNKSNLFCHCGFQQFLIAESHPVEEVCPPRPLVEDGCHARVHRLPRPHACAREGDLPKRRRTSRRWERPNLKRSERFQPRTNLIFFVGSCLMIFFGGNKGWKICTFNSCSFVIYMLFILFVCW